MSEPPPPHLRSGETIYYRDGTTFIDTDGQNTVMDIDGVKTLVVIDDSVPGGIAGMAFTPFGVTKLAENLVLYDMVPLAGRFTEKSEFRDRCPLRRPGDREQSRHQAS